MARARAEDLRKERDTAREFCRELDQILGTPGRSAQVAPESLMGIALRLAEMPSALGPPSQRLESRVLAGALGRDMARRNWSLRWRVLTPVAAGLLAIAIWLGLTPSGHSAMASFAARFGLGQFDVRVTPQPGGAGESYVVATREVLDSLHAAVSLVDHVLLAPARLPDGYALDSIVAVSYENMPVWIPQPFYVDLEYRSSAPDELHDLTLREFGLAVQEGEYNRRIREVGFSSEDVSDARDVTVGDIPAVLVSVGIDVTVPPLKRLIWQQGQVVVEMLSQTMTDEQMLSIAASLAPVE